MRDIEANADLVAMCGLYCGACGSYRKGKCPGCRKNEKATWCKTRTCALTKNYCTCAECGTYQDPGSECRYLHNPIATVFSFIFNSNRPACLRRIREVGREGYAREMAAQEKQSIPRREKKASIT